MSAFLEKHVEAVASRKIDSGEWLAAFKRHLPKYEINTPNRIAMFLAQTSHESMGFSRMTENLNYSAAGLRATFGKYFTNKNPDNYARNPEKIANLVYSNRMGNGGIRSGDGWKYRGRGIIQLTGKYNYTEFSKDTGIDFDEVIPYLETIDGAIHAACWYWDKNRLNNYADAQDIKGATKAINGGYNGLKHRSTLYNRVIGLFGEHLDDVVLDSDDTKPTPSKPKEPKNTDSDSELSKKIDELIDKVEDYMEKDKPAPRYFSIGDEDPFIKRIQKKIGVVADGKFGPMTKRAVKAFQSEYGLVADGIVGPKTLEAMNL